MQSDLCARLILAAVLLLGFGLRLLGIHFGLPHLYHADEPIVVNHALAFGGGDLNPHFFKIPPLASYILFFVYGCFYLIGHAAGFLPDVGSFEIQFYQDPSIFYLLGRFALGVLPGTLSIYVLYRLLHKHFNGRIALISAFLLALNFLHIRDSHYIYTDIVLGLLSLLFYSALFECMDHLDSMKRHLWVGVLAGASAAMKYNGVFFLLPYFFLPLLFKRRNIVCYWPPVGAAALLAFALLNPSAIFDFPYFAAEFQAQAQSFSSSGWTHHLTYSLAGGAGWPLLLMSMGGIFYSLGFGNLKAKLISIFVLGYYALLAVKSQPYDRYALPLIPYLIVLSALFIERVSGLLSGRRGRVAAAVCLVAISLPNAAKAVFFDALMSRSDVRTVAKEWVEMNIPLNSKIAVHQPFFAPPLRFSKQQLQDKRAKVKSDPFFSEAQKRRLDFWIHQSGPAPKYDLFFLSRTPSSFLFTSPHVPYDLSRLRELDIDYVILPRMKPRDEPDDFISRLMQEGELVQMFSPYKDKGRLMPYDEQALTGGPFLWEELWNRERNGLAIEVYRLNRN